MKKKECFKCKKTLPVTSFYKHKAMKDGRLNKCKECNKKDVRENRDNKLDYYREYDRSRANRPERILLRENYVKTDAGKLSANKAKKKWAESNVVKMAASTLVNNRIRSGQIVKAKKCSVCGSTGRIHGHHDDYTKPLDVRWLCSSCHVKWHKENGEGLM